MTTPNLPPTPGFDWREWATALRDYLMKERAQSGRASPIAPQIAHRKSGESAAQDGVLIFDPVDAELEVTVSGQFRRLLRSGTAELDDLADVAVTTPAAGQVVRHNGTQWVNAAALIDDLGDVAVASPAAGQFLRYDAVDARWENTTANLDALSDVVIASPAVAQVVRFNGTNWVNARLASADLSNDASLPKIVAVPATPTSAGTAGQVAYDATDLYICVATNTWRRVAISTW